MTRIPALVAVLALATPLSPASAAGAFTMTGSGTISPGVFELPRTQSVSFAGSASGAGFSASCSFSGTETATYAFAIGTWSGGCGTYRCSSWQVLRAGTYQQMACSVAQVGSVPPTLECVWIPTDILPTTRFTLLCAGAFV